MAEPVAYRYRDSEDEEWQVTELDNAPFGSYKYVEPLYAESHVYPRVGMTMTEFKEWEKLWINDGNWSQVEYDIEYTSCYSSLKEAFWGHSEDMKQLLILWATYNSQDPESTIEIIPDKKWFVVVTNPIVHTGYTYLKIDGLKRMDFYAPKSEAHQFGTKEEAEEWTNPLTSALHLPVEG